MPVVKLSRYQSVSGKRMAEVYRSDEEWTIIFSTKKFFFEQTYPLSTLRSEIENIADDFIQKRENRHAA